ncbi:MAG: trypsin-like serine protease [Hyphomicrobiaceae bacterium]
MRVLLTLVAILAAFRCISVSGVASAEPAKPAAEKTREGPKPREPWVRRRGARQPDQDPMSIAGGRPAAPERWRAIGTLIDLSKDKPVDPSSLKEPGELEKRSYCAGTLIAPTWFLTAGHCVMMGATEEDAPPVETAPDEVAVFIGNVRLDGAADLIPVKEIIRHPDYSPHGPRGNRYDTALIHLKRPPQNVCYALMALGHPNGGPDTAKPLRARVAGWGSSDTTRSHVMLYEADIELAKPEVCHKQFHPKFLEQIRDRVFPELADALGLPEEQRSAFWSTRLAPLAKSVITDDMLCTVGRQGHNHCAGDSGGPVVVEHKGQPVQVGIVNWGLPGCPQLPPGKPRYGVSSRVAHHWAWIVETIGRQPDGRMADMPAACRGGPTTK